MHFGLWYNRGQSCIVDTSPYRRKIREGSGTMRLSEAPRVLASGPERLRQPMAWIDLSDCPEMVGANHFGLAEGDQGQEGNRSFPGN